MAFIFEGRDKTQRTGNEKIAMRNIRGAIDWIVGGYYNCLQDGELDYIPKTYEDLANEVYESSLQDLYGVGSCAFGQAPREMRFAGEKFCRAYIEYKLLEDESDSDVIDIGSEMGWWKEA